MRRYATKDDRSTATSKTKVVRRLYSVGEAA